MDHWRDALFYTLNVHKSFTFCFYHWSWSVIPGSSLKFSWKYKYTRFASLPVPDISQTTFIMSFVASEGWLFPGLEKALTVNQKIKWSQSRHLSCIEQFRKIQKSEKKAHLLARKHTQYTLILTGIQSSKKKSNQRCPITHATLSGVLLFFLNVKCLQAQLTLSCIVWCSSITKGIQVLFLQSTYKRCCRQQNWYIIISKVYIYICTEVWAHFSKESKLSPQAAEPI